MAGSLPDSFQIPAPRFQPQSEYLVLLCLGGYFVGLLKRYHHLGKKHSVVWSFYHLTCIQISQEAGQVVWYSHLLKNFPQFVVIHTVKGFGIVNKAEVNVFLELSCFFDDPTDVGNLISGSSAFSTTSLNVWKFTVHILLKLGLENFEDYFTSV